MPLLVLLLLFTVLPLTEFTLLVRIHDQIGLGWTILLVLGTGVLGAALAKFQGVRTLSRIRQEMAQGRMPGDSLVDGLMILAAGAVLITPGVLTDAFGFALLVPPVRALIKRGLRGWFKRHVHVQSHVAGQTWNADQAPQGEIIEAKVIETRVERD